MLEPSAGKEQQQKMDRISQTSYKPEINGVKMEIELQYREQETDIEEIARRVTEDYAKRGNCVREIKTVQIYLKPTDFTAYYVINDSFEGKVPLF